MFSYFGIYVAVTLHMFMRDQLVGRRAKALTLFSMFKILAFLPLSQGHSSVGTCGFSWIKMF